MFYQVKPGYKHGAFGQYEEGAIVEMTAAEAAGFLDKLQLVAPESAAVVAPVTDEPAEAVVTATDEPAEAEKKPKK